MQSQPFLPWDSSNLGTIIMCKIISLQLGSSLGIVSYVLMGNSIQLSTVLPPISIYEPVFIVGIFIVDQTTCLWKWIPVEQQILENNPTQGDLPDDPWMLKHGSAKNPEFGNQEAKGVLYDSSSP